MKNVVCTKFSNDRAEKYRIITQIIQGEDGIKTVRKLPESKAAAEHVDNIFYNYQLLHEFYLGSKVHVAKAAQVKEGVEIEFVEGVSFESILDQLLEEKDYEGCLGQMEAFFREVFRNKKQGFQASEEFLENFGDVPENPDWETISLIDIDTLFGNVLYHQGQWILYDYEWTLQIDIPVKFIIHRMLNYYLITMGRRVLIDKGIYERFSITSEEVEIFARMEGEFQKSVEDAYVPLWRLYQDIHGKVINAGVLSEHYLRSHMLQIFYDYGQGFREENLDSFWIDEAEGNHYQIEFGLSEGVQAVRIDPANSPCIVKIESITDESGDSLSYATNGIHTEDNTVVYYHSDPQIFLEKISGKKIRLFFAMDVADFDHGEFKDMFLDLFMGMQSELTHKNQLLAEEIQTFKNTQLELTHQNQLLAEEIERMKNTKVWKLYRAVKKED